ncbi:Translation initiation factor eIF-2B subunit gamma [Thecaphora frezii]
MAASFTTAPSAAPPPNTHPPLLQPIVFCGHGNNLYPLCSSPTSAPSLSSPTDAPSTALPKALLPILNRPMIAYPLQQILSAGLRHVIILAPSEQHQQIAAALKTIILIPPVAVPQSKKAASAAAAAAAVYEASRHPNLAVTVGLSSTYNLSGTPGSAPTGGYLAGTNISTSSPSSADSAVMKIDLLPLGPDDVTGKIADAGLAGPASGTKRARKMGTAPLLSWLHSIGRLTRDPLIVPIDFIGQGVSLTTLINSHVAGVPEPPMMTTLVYERGAGEGTGKEREKDGPPKLFTVYDRSPLASGASGTSPSSSASHSLHRLLLLQDSDDISDLDSSDLHLRMSLLWSHPHVRISTSLLDSHIYTFNLNKLLGLLQSKEGQRMKSLREEVVPFIAKCSWMKGLREKAGWTSTPGAADDNSRSGYLIPGQLGRAPSSGNGGASAAGSYVPWTMQASRGEAGGVRRSTTFVEPDLLEGQAGRDSSSGALRASIGRGLPSAPGGFAGSRLGDQTQSSPLFTPDPSRAPSPRTREAMLRSFTPVDPASPSIEADRTDPGRVGDMVGRKLYTSQKARLRAQARQSANEVRAVALIVRLANERSHPIQPDLTIEEVRQREADELASRQGGLALEKFVARANTVPTYIECNRYLLRSLAAPASSNSGSSASTMATPVAVLPDTLPHPLPSQSALPPPTALVAGGVAQMTVSSSASDAGSTGTSVAAAASGDVQLIDAKAQVSTDSVIAEHTRIGERAMIKRSVVGKGCVVAKNAKVTGCIIMDGVRVGEGVKLENCILCPGSVIEDRANLKDCDVAASVRVPSGTNSKNEKFDE